MIHAMMDKQHYEPRYWITLEGWKRHGPCVYQPSRSIKNVLRVLTYYPDHYEGYIVDMDTCDEVTRGTVGEMSEDILCEIFGKNA